MATNDKYRCPKCKQEVEPVATGEKHTNTDNVECEEYACPNCGLKEGRPIK